MDSITVSFCGREWVLERDMEFTEAYGCKVLHVGTAHLFSSDNEPWIRHGWVARAFYLTSELSDSPQSATENLESKLREHWLELGKLLHPEAVSFAAIREPERVKPATFGYED